MTSFNHFLREKEVSNEIRSLLYHIARSIKYINFTIRAGNTGKCGTENSFGESQVAMDVLADDIIANELERSELAKVVISEEREEPLIFKSPRGDFLVAYDPLDGSSLVNVNCSIGSIFGIWDKSDEVIGQTSDKHMVASCYAVYGPRITFVIAIKGKGVHEFELNDVGEFILVEEGLKIEDDSKYFAPGNLRACAEDAKFKSWVDECIMSGKTLRYSGGMVPDLNHILLKGNGIFVYPRYSKYPEGKLRLLFECAPFAFVFREAGGIALNQDGVDILDVPVTDCHQTSPILIGSKNAVKKAVEMIGSYYICC